MLHYVNNLHLIANILKANQWRIAWPSSWLTRFKVKKAEIKAKADALEAESSIWDHRSDEELHKHHRWEQATTALQISIALAAIALLTRKDWMKRAMYFFSSLGLLLGVLAALHL